jgi:hypothetical protein
MAEPRTINLLGGQVYNVEKTEERFGETVAYFTREITQVHTDQEEGLNGKQDLLQFAEMPDAQAYDGKYVQYIGADTQNYKQGLFYKAVGGQWKQRDVSANVIVCDSLPIWASAKADTLYYVSVESKAYIKNTSVNGSWLSLGGGSSGGSGSAFELVTQLPAWSDADPAVIYLLIDDGKATGYVKNQTNLDSWFKVGGTVDYNELANTPTINGIETAGTVGHKNDVALEAEVDGVATPVNDLAFEAYTPAEIAAAFGA